MLNCLLALLAAPLIASLIFFTAFAQQAQPGQAGAQGVAPVALSFQATLSPDDRVLVIQGQAAGPKALLELRIAGKSFWLIHDAAPALPDQAARWYYDQKLKALVIIWADSTVAAGSPKTVQLVLVPDKPAAGAAFQVQAMAVPPQSAAELNSVPGDKTWQVVAQ
ncbi:MAG: hypothetical protein D6715_05265 [Calditrichaeota bacterium]|nr:MAG: hypothetical protein D6715_05265 [Calditrichota bacterium]